MTIRIDNIISKGLSGYAAQHGMLLHWIVEPAPLLVVPALACLALVINSPFLLLLQNQFWPSPKPDLGRGVASDLRRNKRPQWHASGAKFRAEFVYTVQGFRLHTTNPSAQVGYTRVRQSWQTPQPITLSGSSLRLSYLCRWLFIRQRQHRRAPGVVKLRKQIEKANYYHTMKCLWKAGYYVTARDRYDFPDWGRSYRSESWFNGLQNLIYNKHASRCTPCVSIYPMYLSTLYLLFYMLRVPRPDISIAHPAWIYDLMTWESFIQNSALTFLPLRFWPLSFEDPRHEFQLFWK